jgi:hypothetical protein
VVPIPGVPVRLSGALVAFTVVVGCADAAGPSGLLGSYALERVGSTALPTIVYVSEDVTIRVLADTLHLYEGGVGTRADLLHITTAGDPQPDNPIRGESHFTFRMARASFEISFDCPPNAHCAPPPHMIGHLSGNRLVIRHSLAERVPQVFARVP